MVETVQFQTEPARIMYMPLPDGSADVWLRRDIRSETSEDGTEGWIAEEVYLHTEKSRDEIARDFDAYFEPERTAEQRIESLESAVADLSGLVTTTTAQSDKLGCDWKITKVGNMEVLREYVEQENPRGVKDNPFEYYDGVELIDNAYYMKDGKLQVYMAGEWVEI